MVRAHPTVPLSNSAIPNAASDEIAEYGASGNLVERYVPGPAIDEPIARVRDTGNTTYFHTNRQGSVIAMSGTSGALSEGPFTYSPYGVCTSGGLACPASGIPYRYTGRRFDPETGLYYYRARYYGPDDTRGGRFLQTDPVGYTADMNLYTYGENDPTDEEDPSGLYGIDDPMWDTSSQNQLQWAQAHPQTAAWLAGALSTGLLGASGAVAGCIPCARIAFGSFAAGSFAYYNGASPKGILDAYGRGAAVSAGAEAGGKVGFGWVGKGIGAAGGAAQGNAAYDAATGRKVDPLVAAVSAVTAGGTSTMPSGEDPATAIAAQVAKKATGKLISSAISGALPRRQGDGSGRSSNFGKIIPAQGSRICPKDSSGQHPNSC